ncbi:MAG: hypothetical protein AB7V40_06770, partial [Methyloceanibacter sp.]
THKVWATKWSTPHFVRRTCCFVGSLKLTEERSPSAGNAATVLRTQAFATANQLQLVNIALAVLRRIAGCVTRN